MGKCDIVGPLYKINLIIIKKNPGLELYYHNIALAWSPLIQEWHSFHRDYIAYYGHWIRPVHTKEVIAADILRLP